MTELLQGSVLLRLLAGLGQGIRACWEDSALRRMLRGSVFVQALTRLIKSLLAMSDSATRNSRYARLGQRINDRLAGADGLREAVRSSLLYRIYGAVMTCGQNSRILGWMFRGGMVRIVLTVLGLYALVDYGLRDVLSIPVISSIWDEALMVLCCGWILWERVKAKAPLQSRANPLDYSVWALLVMGLALMAVQHPFPSIQIAGYRATMQYILWFFLLTRLLRDDGDFRFLYAVMVVLAAGIALHGIYQYIIAVPIPASWMTSTETSVRTRVFSIFGSPNIMGDFMVMFAPMTVGLAYSVKDWRLKILLWACGLCMCLSCLFTMSRGAWVAMAAAVVLFVLMVDRRLFLVLLGAGIVACCIPFVASRIGFLFTEDFAHASANGGRSSRWALTMSLLLRNDPVFGLGHGMFGGAVAMQNQVLNCEYFYVDNYYLKTMAEMGYVGLGAFILTQLGVLFTGARSVFRTKQAGDTMFPMCAGMLSGLVGVLIHCFFENIFEEPYMEATYWIIAALLVYAGFLRGKNAGPSEKTP